MSYNFRFMAYLKRIMVYIFRFRAYINRNLPNCERILLKSLELESIVHKKYCLQPQFVAIVGFGLLKKNLILKFKILSIFVMFW